MSASKLKTVKRDWLRRQVEAGKVVCVSAYHFDDMYGESRTSREMPVAMMPVDRHDAHDGTVYLFPSDFTSGSGSAYRTEGGSIISLHVHSNSNYDLRIKQPGD